MYDKKIKKNGENTLICLIDTNLTLLNDVEFDIFKIMVAQLR
jgi:hypothetical protein